MTESISQAVKQIKNAIILPNLDESATKQGVVLKMLSLAGWNAFDVSEIVPEYTVGNRRVDYALSPGSACTVFIEVKRPSENLEAHQQQLLEYCFQEGVKLAALTNGRTWWLYLPLQSGNWEQRRFLTIDLESQEPEVVEQRFIAHLSKENVDSGRAVTDAEELMRSQQRSGVASKAIVEAWNQIVEMPDDILVDLVSETAERICGFKPEADLVEQFLSQFTNPLPINQLQDASEDSNSPGAPNEASKPSARQIRALGRSSPLPITLVPDNPEFKAELLRKKLAWIEISYIDGRKEVRRWDAPHMERSSNVMGNLRSRPEFRQGNWQGLGIRSVQVSIERPSS